MSNNGIELGCTTSLAPPNHNTVELRPTITKLSPTQKLNENFKTDEGTGRGTQFVQDCIFAKIKYCKSSNNEDIHRKLLAPVCVPHVLSRACKQLLEINRLSGRTHPGTILLHRSTFYSVPYHLNNIFSTLKHQEKKKKI
jgi:hypothetical protein